MKRFLAVACTSLVVVATTLAPSTLVSQPLPELVQSMTETDVLGNLWLKFPTIPGKTYQVEGSSWVDGATYRPLTGGVFYGDGTVKSFFMRPAPPADAATPPATYQGKPRKNSEWLLTLAPSTQPGNNLTMLVTRVKVPPETSWTIQTTQPIMRPFESLGFNPTATRLDVEVPEWVLSMKLNFATSATALDLTGIPGPESLTGADAEEWVKLDENKLSALGFLVIPTGSSPAISPRPEGSTVFLRVRIIEGDSNGNSLPDWWELAHNFNPYAQGAGALDPDADADNDGYSNFQEYLMGTNPNVADPPGSTVPDFLTWIQTDLADYRQIANESDTIYPLFNAVYNKSWDNPTTEVKTSEATLSVAQFTINPRTTFPWPTEWISEQTLSLSQLGIRKAALDEFRLYGKVDVPTGSGEWMSGNTQNASLRLYSHEASLSPLTKKFLAISSIKDDVTNQEVPSEEHRTQVLTFTIPAGNSPRFSSSQDVSPLFNETSVGTQSSELILLPLKAKMWETTNKSNHILNTTKKDDTSSNAAMMESEGDATYAVPRNILYIVADEADNKFRVSLELPIPSVLKGKMYAAAWVGGNKVVGSDTLLTSESGQPTLLEIPAEGDGTKEYLICVGLDLNENKLLETSEATALPAYTRVDNQQVRYITIKGISNTKYEEHKNAIKGRIHFWGQSPPGFPAKYARSFLALHYYKGNFIEIEAGVRPATTTTVLMNAFATGLDFAEWLTHSSGAEFNNNGVTELKEYEWDKNSEVAKFFVKRTPFALETVTSNSQGYYEYQTPTGTTLEAFYQGYVKALAEQALQQSPVGSTMTFPLDGGWYEFPRAEAPTLFLSSSPGNWVTTSTLLIGEDDGNGGLSALFGDIATGSSQFDEFDAFGAIGRGRVRSPRYQFTIKKQETGIFSTNIEYKVSAVNFTCDIEDLYDFNYEDGLYPSHAAAMQIGWGRGTKGAARDQGKIYRHRIHLEHIYPYPFEQTIILSPGP